MTVTISVVIPTYKRPDRIPPLLEALDSQTLPPDRFEVIMVDNCSQDDTSDVVTSAAAGLGCRVRLLQTEVNRGPAPARNLGWRQASSEFVAFLDDDCLPEPGWLEAGLKSIESDPTLGVVQGATRPPRAVRPGEHDDHYVIRVVDRPTPYFEACNIFYRRDALAATGGFDEVLGFWGEDTAAGWRVVDGGWDRGFTSDAVVVHPVEHRGWRWHIDTGLLEANLMQLAKAHPGFRREAFWRPWAYRKQDAAFVLALVSLAAAVRFRPALLGILPYCWLRRPSMRRRTFFRLCLQIPFIDLARLAGQLKGSLRYRLVAL